MLTLQKTKLAIIIAIFLLLTVNFSSNYNSCKAATQISLLEELDHVVEINEYGFLIINETMMFYNNYSMTVSVPQVTLTYPPSYFSKMSLVNITDNRFALSISKTADSAVAILSPTAEIALNAGASINVTVSFIGENLVSSGSSELFYVNLLLYPGVSLNASKTVSAVNSPLGTTFPLLPGYVKETSGGKDYYSRTYTNLTKNMFSLYNASMTVSTDADVVIMEVPRVERTIQVENDGSLWVIDMFQLRNLGYRNISSIYVNLLNKKVSSVKLVPPVGPEEDYSIGFFGQVSFKITVQYNGAYTFRIKYPAPEGLVKFTDGKYVGSFNTSSPYNGIVEEYVLRESASNGFKTSTENPEIVLKNVTQYSKGTFTISYEPKLFWSAANIIPIGLLILVLLLGVFSYSQKNEAKEREYSGELLGIVQDKLELINSTVQLYDQRLSGAVQKQKFNISRQEHYSMINQINGRLANIRTELIKENPGKEKNYEQILNLNRGIDQNLKTLASHYDTMFSGKINREEFEKRRSNSTKKLNQLETDIKEEVEGI